MLDQRLGPDVLHIDLGLCQWQAHCGVFLGMETTLDAVVDEGDETSCDDDAEELIRIAGRISTHVELTQERQSAPPRRFCH